MGQVLSERLPNFTDVQVEDLRRSLAAAARRMSEEQILDLADVLHETMRRRRGSRRSRLSDTRLL